MCRGITQKGKPCKNPQEPYCKYHSATPQPSKFEKRFKKGPTKADGPGYIYIYYLEGETDYYKIGSSVDAEKRIKEWGGIKKKAYYVHFRQLAERLIHIQFDKLRVFRYRIDANIYITVWKATNEPVTEKDAALKELHELHAFQKNVEWFKATWEILEQEIGAIINLVNDKGYRRSAYM